MIDPELKGCAFCGEVHLDVIRNADGVPLFRLSCDCGRGSVATSPELCRRMWNKQAGDRDGAIESAKWKAIHKVKYEQSEARRQQRMN